MRLATPARSDLLDGHVTPTDPLIEAEPTRRGTGRLLGVDVARGLALIAMFTQHVGLTDASGGGSTGWVGWFFTESSGRAAVLFFILSGVSLMMIHRRGSRSADAGALRRRGLLLLAGGLLLTQAFWGASIIQHYGVMFLIAPWLLRLGNRALAAVTAGGLIGGPIAMLFLPRLTDDVAGIWTGASGAWVITTAWELLVGFYPLVIWAGYFTLGMLVGRLDLTSKRTVLRLAIGATCAVFALGGLASLATNRIGTPDQSETSGSAIAADQPKPAKPVLPATLTEEQRNAMTQAEYQAYLTQLGAFYDLKATKGEMPVEDWRSLPSTAGHSGKLGNTTQTSAIALAVLGWCLAACRLKGATRLLRPLAITGSMSLTAYLVHIILVNDIWEHLVANRSWSIATQEWAFAGLVATMIGLCVVFKRLLGTGPMERLLKHLTTR